MSGGGRYREIESAEERERESGIESWRERER